MDLCAIVTGFGRGANGVPSTVSDTLDLAASSHASSDILLVRHHDHALRKTAVVSLASQYTSTQVHDGYGRGNHSADQTCFLGSTSLALIDDRIRIARTFCSWRIDHLYIFSKYIFMNRFAYLFLFNLSKFYGDTDSSKMMSPDPALKSPINSVGDGEYDLYTAARAFSSSTRAASFAAPGVAAS